jgi:two-component system, cell cycle response regulator
MKVLIADDDEVSRLTLSSLLEGYGCELHITKDGHEAMAVINQTEAPELIFLDWNMPGINGVEITSLIRQNLIDSPPYVIIVSSNNKKDQIIEALAAGADDFITKPIDGLFLKAKYAVAERILRVQDRLVNTNKMLEKLAYYDELTGVMNRRAGIVAVDIEIERCIRKNELLAVALLDIDHFKHINDFYGHPEGDKVLKQFSKHVQQTLRPYDVLCRYGGEEFLIAACLKKRDESELLFERIRSTVENMDMEFNQAIDVTTSIGVCIHQPSQHSKVANLIKQADEALYEAKGAGRNKIVTVPD